MSTGYTTSKQKLNSSRCSGSTRLFQHLRRRRWWPQPEKVMAHVFWGAKGMLIIDYFWKGCTINGEYYAILFRQLGTEIKSKWPEMVTKGVLFHQDNAPAHKSLVAMPAIRDCGFELVDHPPYSPDLAPSDYYLFPIMKKIRVKNDTSQMMTSYPLRRIILRVRKKHCLKLEAEVKTSLEVCGRQSRLCRKITLVGSCLTIAS